MVVRSGNRSEPIGLPFNKVSDDEMQKIAAQLHFNVRRQMLFKAPSRAKAERLGGLRAKRE